jgi:hypothetical protein
MPKSLDVSKALDKQRHDRSQVLRVTRWIAEARDAAGISNKDIDAAFGFAGMAGHWTSSKSQPAVPTLDQVPTLLDVLKAEPPPEIRELLVELNSQKGQPGPNWGKRPVTGEVTKARTEDCAFALPTGESGATAYASWATTAPATPEASRWAGWGTALAPGHELYLLARKPLTGSVAANTLAWGCGGVNVDGCRVETTDTWASSGHAGPWNANYRSGAETAIDREGHPAGRWPKNLLLSCDPACTPDGGHAPGCPAGELDRQSGHQVDRVATKRPGCSPFSSGDKTARTHASPSYHGSGGASRFYPHFRYQAKASDRRVPGKGPKANRHPTHKPIDLMRWLVRLVTPTAAVAGQPGICLDPFSGSGSTGVAAALEGVSFVGFELDPEHADNARARIAQAHKDPSYYTRSKR